MQFNAGRVTQGFYIDGNLRLNGVNLGELEVQDNDADSALRDAMNAVDGISANFNDDNELILTHATQIAVDGTNTHGNNFVCEHLALGTYEQESKMPTVGGRKYSYTKKGKAAAKKAKTAMAKKKKKKRTRKA